MAGRCRRRTPATASSPSPSTGSSSYLPTAASRGNSRQSSGTRCPRRRSSAAGTSRRTPRRFPTPRRAGRAVRQTTSGLQARCLSPASTGGDRIKNGSSRHPRPRARRLADHLLGQHTGGCLCHLQPPGTQLWHFNVSPDQVSAEWVAFDRFPDQPQDSCFKYSLDLGPSTTSGRTRTKATSSGSASRPYTKPRGPTTCGAGRPGLNAGWTAR